MKRVAICVLVLGLALLGPSPVSLCVLASSLVTDCASAETQSQCDQMDMGTHSSPALAASTVSCCAVSQAPVPETKSAPSIPALEQGPATISALAVKVVNFERGHLVDVRRASPPPLQSLLCTFLI